MGESEIEAWIATATGRTVRHLQRVGYGASRATFIAEMDAGPDLVARVDTGDGPMAGTELTLVREAEAYRALEDTGVRIPRLHAVAPDGMALLADRAPGTHELQELSDDARRAVDDDYIDALAELHNVPAGPLDLPSYRRPADGPAHATNELDLWGGILRTRTAGPWPLAEFALSVLRRAAPATVSRTVLCHGDVGPGNYLHADGKVTALLDWEFCHVGDPMDDLGGWLFRGYDMAAWRGDLGAQLRRWSERTGVAVDARSVEYYRALTMIRWLVSVATTIENGGSGMDRSVHFALVPVLAVRLPRALATLVDVELPAPGSPIADAEPGPNARVLGALRDDLRDVIGPAVQSTEGRRRLMASEIYLSHLEAVDRVGPRVAEEEAADIAATLGHAPASPAVGERELAELAKRSDLDRAAEVALLHYFWRLGLRLLALWPVVEPRAMADPTPVPES